MFKNYLLMAFLNLRKQPFFSAIKILSLTIGLASAVLVYMHVSYVQDTNKHIANWENTYRLVTHMRTLQDNIPYRTRASAEPYAPQLRLDYAEQIERIARIRQANGVFGRDDESAENNYTWAEADALFIFDLDFLSGDPESAISEPNTMVISESVAAKYFGDEEPMGQVLTLDDQADIRVTGVFRDVPDNATTPLEILISVATGRQLFGENFMFNNNWILFQGTRTYLTVRDRTTAEQLNDDLANFIERNVPEGEVQFAAQFGLGLSLQPLDDIYLNPLTNFGSVENSTTRTVLYGLITFSLLILASSCINYMNLSLAQVSQRAREVGVRKTLGANRGDILWQFLVESLLLTLLALVLALPLIAAVLPTYTALTATGFTIAGIVQSGFILFLGLVVLLTGLVAGIVPALSLSRLQVAEINSGANAMTRLGKLVKAGITAAQFSVSSILILLAIAIYLQTDHMRTQDLAFDKDNLVILDSRFSTSDPDAFNYTAMMNELARHPAIESLGASSMRPPNQPGVTTFRTQSMAPDEGVGMGFAFVDPGFIDTYRLELLAGRGFSEDFPADFLPPEQADTEALYSVVITDLVAGRFGFASPQAAVGEVVLLGGLELQVIGVVRRFLLQGGAESAETGTGALLGRLTPLRFIHLRIDPAQTDAALAHIDSVWAQQRPGIPLDRAFFTQEFDSLIEARTGGISAAALFASLITIFIAVCGLFALASYASLRRTKEVGVRKVLGANAGAIIGLLAWDFVKPVLLACVVSWPIAYYFITDFYADFSSTVDFSALNYLAVTAGIVLLSLVTVAAQCHRTANADPVQSLRYE